MTRRAIVVHSLVHARAALTAAAELGVALTLQSAPGAAAYLGAPVFRDMVDAAAAAFPEVTVTAVLDCGDAPGHALNALRHGIRTLRVDVTGAVRERLADIAGQCGAVLDDDAGPVLDLADAPDPLDACRRWLAGCK